MTEYKDIDNIIRSMARHEFCLEAIMGEENYLLSKKYRKPVIIEYKD